MAEATARTARVITTTVTLTLDAKEAGTLLAVLGRISGADEGPRGYSTAVYNALNALSTNHPDIRDAQYRAAALMTNRLGAKGPVGVHFNTGD